MIGGFFFLRFINPAIVSPQAYMLIDSAPGKFPKRTLTLIAKLLQNVANKPTYAKEEYMMLLNGFVETNRNRVDSFLDELCEVDDFYEALQVNLLFVLFNVKAEQYLLGNTHLNFNIPINEVFYLHDLIAKHIHTIVTLTFYDSFIDIRSRGSFIASYKRAWRCHSSSVTKGR